MDIGGNVNRPECPQLEVVVANLLVPLLGEFGSRYNGPTLVRPNRKSLAGGRRKSGACSLKHSGRRCVKPLHSVEHQLRCGTALLGEDD